MVKNIKLFVVTHKELEYTLPERTLIGVGNKYINNVSIYDNSNDNISKKNANYCELTAMYWIWKNIDADIVGIEHYRRQFKGKNGLLGKNEITEILDNYDVITPKKKNASASVYQDYCNYHYELDLNMLREVIENLYPEYINDFDCLKHTNKFYVCNMLITTKKIYDSYCNWLFEILFELEKHLDLSNRNPYQKRVYGFLSERLFNVYLHHFNNLKIKEIEISEPDNVKRKYLTQKFILSREVKYIIKKIINYHDMYR